MHAFGADCMEEHGKVVILGKSAENYTHKEVPWKPVGWTHNRMYMKDLEAIVEAVSPTAARVEFRIQQSCTTLESPLTIFKLCLLLLYCNIADKDHRARGSERTSAHRRDQLPDPQAGRHPSVRDPEASDEGTDGPPMQPRTADPLQPRILQGLAAPQTEVMHSRGNA